MRSATPDLTLRPLLIAVIVLLAANLLVQPFRMPNGSDARREVRRYINGRFRCRM